MEVLQAHIISTAEVFGRDSVACLNRRAFPKAKKTRAVKTQLTSLVYQLSASQIILPSKNMMRPGYDKYFG